MLDIARLLSVDDQFPAAAAISECLGDRFLYANNQIFRHVRNLFLDRGFRFISDLDERARPYFAAPLVSLEDLVTQGFVPYRNNTSVLSRLAARAPEFRIAPTSLLSQLTHNHVLHESAHLIANRILTDLDAEAPRSKIDIVLHAVICESFANVLECLTVAFTRASHVHRFFLALNCYVNYTPEFPRQEKFLQELIGMLGFRETFEFGFLGFLHTNTHDAPPGEAVLASWLRTIFGHRPISGAEAMLLDVALRQTFVLAQSFRRETSRIYFSALQCEQEYRSFSDMRFSGEELGDLGVSEKLKLLSGIVAGGIRPAFPMEAAEARQGAAAR